MSQLFLQYLVTLESMTYEGKKNVISISSTTKFFVRNIK